MMLKFKPNVETAEEIVLAMVAVGAVSVVIKLFIITIRNRKAIKYVG